MTDQALQWVLSETHHIRNSFKVHRNGLKIISKSVSRVAKKKQPDDVDGFMKSIMANIETTTDAYVPFHPWVYLT